MNSWDKYTFGGLISSQPVPNGNMVGITAFAHFRFMEKGKTSPYGAALFYQIVDKCLARDLNKNTDAAIDDYLCATCIPSIAEKLHTPLLPYNLEKQGFLYNFKRWFIRSTGVMGNMLGSNFLKAVSIFNAANQLRSNQDAWIQSYCMVISYRFYGNKSWLMDKAVSYWYSKLPAPIDVIFLEYSQDENHPLSHPIEV